MTALFSEHAEGQVTVLTLSSDNIDTTNVAEFERQLEHVLAEEKYRLVLDLNQLGFISSAGLRSLLLSAKAARRGGGDLRLAGATATVRRVFLLVGMQDIFRIFDDVPAAIASFD